MDNSTTNGVDWSERQMTFHLKELRKCCILRWRPKKSTIFTPCPSDNSAWVSRLIFLNRAEYIQQFTQ